MPRTYYDVLGVPEDADADAIRAAYRERVKETHPDQSDDPDAGDRFRRVRKAKEVLTDRSERRRYDRLGHERYVGNGAEGANDGPTREWTHRPTGGTATGYRRRQRARRKWAEAQREAQRDSEGGESPSGRSGSGTENEASTEGTTGGRAAAGQGGGATGTTGTTGTAGASGHAGHGASTGAGATRAGTAARAAATAGAGHGAGATAGPTDAAGYRVRRGSQPGPQYTPAKVGLAAVTFLLYPVLVASAVLPAFPLVVNVVVGVCTLLLVTYLLSVPEVAVLVFGGWTLLAPALLTVTGVGVVTPVGFFAWAACWLPGSLSVANFVFLSA